jgi:hypothetical protein
MCSQPRNRHVDEYVGILLETIGEPVTVENEIVAAA